MVLGGVLGYFIPVFTYSISYSFYDRTQFDIQIENMFGGMKVNDSLTDETIIVAYSFNLQQPRFYSKFFAQYLPEIFDLTLAQAVQASISTPFIFDPFIYTNGKG